MEWIDPVLHPSELTENNVSEDTILISCELGAHIHPAGFHDWNRENTHDTVYYAEYASFPATSDYRPLSDRADFVQNLNEQQAGYFAKELVLGDWAPDKL